MGGEKEGIQKVKNDNGPPSEHKVKVITKPNKVHHQQHHHQHQRHHQ